MFGQYGIKVSFGGSGTLKIVIYVETHPQNNVRIFWLDDITPLESRGCYLADTMNVLTIYIHGGVIHSV